MIVDAAIPSREIDGVALILRPAEARDGAALAVLAADAFRSTYADLLDDTTIDTVVGQTCTAPAFVELVARAEPDQLLVAEENGVLQGFLDFVREPDGLELRRLYARAGETGRGVGAALLAALERTLPAGTTYRIVVVQANIRGLAFWQRHGFSVQRVIDGLEHFAAHRQVQFHPDSGPTPLLELHRTTTQPGT